MYGFKPHLPPIEAFVIARKQGAGPGVVIQIDVSRCIAIGIDSDATTSDVGIAMYSVSFLMYSEQAVSPCGGECIDV